MLISSGLACTSAVISGKATVDGRPLLWKHRDTGFVRNKVVYIEGEQYDFIGVANLVDTLSKEIWMGQNSAGFAIMNTASYNINTGQTCDVPDDQEGLFMRRALETCANLADFERLLEGSSGEWGIAANFGAIDAQGGAAYYETGYYNYTKYDATDDEIAPDGYLVRTNYSFSGDDENGYGFIRLENTEKLFRERMAQQKFDADFILSEATRNFYHSRTRTDLLDLPLPADSTDTHFVPFRDFVVRYSSASTFLAQGVLPDEDPRFTTMWTILGWQPAALITPLWIFDPEMIPDIVQSRENQPAPLNHAALQLKRRSFPDTRGNGDDYVNLAMLTNKAGTGLLELIAPADTEIITRTMALQEQWREKGYRDRDLKKFNRWLEAYIRDIYAWNYNITF